MIQTLVKPEARLLPRAPLLLPSTTGLPAPPSPPLPLVPGTSRPHAALCAPTPGVEAQGGERSYKKLPRPAKLICSGPQPAIPHPGQRRHHKWPRRMDLDGQQPDQPFLHPLER